MEEAKEKKAPRKSWWAGLKSEYRKIIWPDKTDLTKQTAAVVVVSAVLGVLITIIDYIVQNGIDILIG